MPATKMSRNFRAWFVSLLLPVIFLTHAICGFAQQSENAQLLIVVGTEAPPLERFAAEELAQMLESLFPCDADIDTKMDDSADATFLLGRPDSNPLLAKAVGDQWPDLTEQGILLRRLESETLTMAIGGGSPVAVMWATYELGERFGVRYLIDRDVYPPRRAWDNLPDLNVVMEPNLTIRCWRLVNDLAPGPVSWSLEENERYLRQLAKMKFNRIHTFLWPAHPFVDYTFRGMPKPSPFLYFGFHFPIDTDTVGYEKLGEYHKHGEFTNPELVGAKSKNELVQRGVGLVRGIHAEAHRLGMQTQVSIEPFNWPKDFIKVIPNAQPARQLGNVTIQPGNDQSLNDPLLGEMVTTVIRAYIQTYPGIDYIGLTVPEKRRWVSQGSEAYRRLHEKYDLSELGTYDDLCARARSRSNFPGGGKRVETQVKSDLAALWLLDSLFQEHRLLERPDGKDIKIILDSLTEELFPLVARIVPPGGEVLSFIDYTASRVVQRRDLIEEVPVKDVPVSLIMTLADDNVGVLPQLATGSMHQLLAELRNNGWAGYYTRYWTIGEQDPAIHYLAKASWDESWTPQQAYADQLAHICGPGSVVPAMKAFELIEQITLGMDQYGLGFGFPVPGLMTKHYNSGGLSKEMQQDHQRYRQAHAYLSETLEASRPEGREWMRYFVNRLHFAIRYLDAAVAYGATSVAEKAENPAEAQRQSQIALDAIREALNVYVSVVKDHGDLGAVALMNEYCYRPIRDKRDELAD